MRRSLLLGTCLTILILTGRGAEASPLQLRIGNSSFPLADGSFGDTFSLADSSQAGSHSWTTAAISRPAPGQPLPPFPPGTFDQGFWMLLGVDNGEGGFLGPHLSIYGSTGPSDLALYEGKATSVEIRYGSPEDLPLLLRDWLTHPEHLRISGNFGPTSGSSYLINTTLSFDAPTVPEPATWAAWSLVGVGAVLVRRRRGLRARD